MATFTNTGSKTVKVMYKVAGVQYRLGTEADPLGRVWDEVVVAPGATVELGDVTWQKTVELADVQVAVVRVGPQRGAPQDIVIEEREVTSADTLTLRLATGGGQAIRFIAR